MRLKLILLPLVMQLMPLPSLASDVLPLGGVYYDNLAPVAVTVGVANTVNRSEHSDSGYYVDFTYGEDALLFSLGMGGPGNGA